MKKIIAIFLIFFLNILNAEAQRQTTFDDRPTCEKNGGLWREFGNGCANNCISKFDKYEICTRAIIYSCDCGKDRCWNESECVSISQYQKIFDKENSKKEKILEAKQKEREERIAKDPNLKHYLQNLYVEKNNQNTAQGQNQNNNGKNSQKSQQSTGQNRITQQQPPQVFTPQIASEQNLPAGAITRVENNATQNEVPALFLQQEQQKKQETLAQQKTGATNNQSATPPLEIPRIPIPQ